MLENIKHGCKHCTETCLAPWKLGFDLFLNCKQYSQLTDHLQYAPPCSTSLTPCGSCPVPTFFPHTHTHLQLGDLMGAIARKAAHDTQMLGNMIAQKAQHDMNTLQEQKKPPAPAAP